MTDLSTRLRDLADTLEDTEFDDDREAHLVFRADFDEDTETVYKQMSERLPTELSVQLDDRYEGSIQVTTFLRE